MDALRGLALLLIAQSAGELVARGSGAARALPVDPDAGTCAGLALGVQVVLAALLMPLVFTLF